MSQTVELFMSNFMKLVAYAAATSLGFIKDRNPFRRLATANGGRRVQLKAAGDEGTVLFSTRMEPVYSRFGESKHGELINERNGIEQRIEACDRRCNVWMWVLIVAITVAAVCIIWTIVSLGDGKAMTNEQYYRFLAVRISLAVFFVWAAIVAKKQYDRESDMISAFQKESTNVSTNAEISRLAVHSNNHDIFRKVIEIFSKVERNPVTKTDGAGTSQASRKISGKDVGTDIGKSLLEILNALRKKESEK